MTRRDKLVRALVLAVAVSASNCLVRQPSAPPVRLVIAAGVSGGVHDPVGEALARVLSARIPGMRAHTLVTAGSVFNVDAIEAGEADVAGFIRT